VTLARITGAIALIRSAVIVFRCPGCYGTVRWVFENIGYGTDLPFQCSFCGTCAELDTRSLAVRRIEVIP